MGKIQHLINQMFKKAEKDESAYYRNTKLADQLRSYGSQVVDLILTELFNLSKSHKLHRVIHNTGCPVLHLALVATEFAGAKHSRKFAEMLLWDKKIFEKDGSTRSTRSILLKGLSRIGTPTVISLLKKYAETLETWEQKEVMRTINQILSRVSSLPI